uniref:Uncharacterized protein n=1 Tax=Alexandrium catenella TaxID=2925 RepID=A0A7S1R6Q3_ALECA|mmetsp:Transcript_45217/g.121728  ORF Transcript_45217/g.121728 Transcript_45217/m.121728 type:complete len:176 (+) Transcript_45217:56-583(+)|eukprot:CAMPEP_0171210114 /NCGR_PEP_ID=MMETSP0790-20130122/28941_1 /TAXON_ID=2925 /ORGANISM="Alexandrium catenella, Strain OF101" /LENGTH=175 /DNA_ID=CAMNT_0011675739 /DNA_START=52 /DNA_END=579 /DNA_ORIENTATION=-
MADCEQHALLENAEAGSPASHQLIGPWAMRRLAAGLVAATLLCATLAVHHLLGQARRQYTPLPSVIELASKDLDEVASETEENSGISLLPTTTTSIVCSLPLGCAPGWHCCPGSNGSATLCCDGRSKCCPGTDGWATVCCAPGFTCVEGAFGCVSDVVAGAALVAVELTAIVLLH